MKIKKFLEDDMHQALAVTFLMAGVAGFVACTPVEAISLNDLVQVNPVYEEYMQDVAEGNGSAWTLIPNKYRTVLSEDGGKGADELPESYSLIEAGYGTTVKNQGLDGDCWAFALTTAIESNLKKNGVSVEFAPKQMDYLMATGSPYYAFVHNNWGFSRELAEGGNFAISSIMLGGKHAPVEEEEFFAVMQANDSELGNYTDWKEFNDRQLINYMLGDDLDAYTKTMNISQIMSEKAEYVVTDYRGYSANTIETPPEEGGEQEASYGEIRGVSLANEVDLNTVNRVKLDVYNNGAVWVGTYSPSSDSTCYDAETKTIIDRGTACTASSQPVAELGDILNIYGEGVSGHAMVIVGWDDTHTYTDNGETKQGAFLLQNSWGESDLFSSRNIDYDSLVGLGKIDESTLTAEEIAWIKNYINNYDADEYVWLAYDFETSTAQSTIDFGSIEKVRANDYDDIYDIIDVKKVKAVDNTIEWTFATEGDKTQQIEAVTVGTTVLKVLVDTELVAYIDNGDGYELVGNVPMAAGNYGQGIIELEKPIEVDGDFRVKLAMMYGEEKVGGVSDNQEYFKAAVYVSDKEVEVPATSAPDTGFFTGEGVGAKITGIVLLVMTLAGIGVSIYAYQERKHLFHKVKFTKK